MDITVNPMIQVLEYIEKKSGKSSFVYYRGYGNARITAFNKKAISQFVKEVGLTRKNFNDYESGLVLGIIDDNTYLLIEHSYDLNYELDLSVDMLNNSIIKKNCRLILATSDLSKNQELSIIVNGDVYKKEFEHVVDYGYIEDFVYFNGFTKKEHIMNKVKNFNQNRYNVRKPVSKQEQFKNLPLAYHGKRTTTPKRKAGIRTLENSFRKMI